MRSPTRRDYPALDMYSRDSDEHAAREADRLIQECQQQYQPRVELAPKHSRRPRQFIEGRKFYLALVFDECTGKLSRQSSANLKPFKNNVLHEASQKFATVLQSHFPLHRVRLDEEARREIEESTKRSRYEAVKLETTGEDTPRPHKSRRVKSRPIADVADSVPQHASFSSQVDQEDIEREDLVQYRMDAQQEWERWFNDAFRAVQQVSCRVIAKEWIKLIHPKKQSTHPYNGKNPATGERGDPDSTKPAYWPKDVIHKEPDHINKEARVKLLVHLLMNTPHKEISPPSEHKSGEPGSAKEINAGSLKDALDQKSSERAMVELRRKFGIVEQIIHVRTQLEHFQEGGYDGNSYLSVPNYADFGRGSRNEDDSDDPPDEALEVIAEQDEDSAESVLITEPENIDTAMSDDEPGASCRSGPAGSNEHSVRTKCRKKPTREENHIQAVPWNRKSINTWPGPPPSSGIHPPQVLDYSNLEQPFMHREATKPPDRMHHHPHQEMERQMHECYSPAVWHAMNGQMDLSSMYNNSCLASPGAIPEMDQIDYMHVPYDMMSQSSYGGVPQYFQRYPAGNIPYHHVRQPSMSHEQTLQAFFSQ